MRRRAWAAPAKVVRELVFGPDGPGTSQAVNVEIEQTFMPLAGDLGRPVFGMKGDPAITCNGWVVDPQSFRGAAQMGARPDPAWEPPQALPSTHEPQALASWLQTWAYLEGVVP